MENNKLDIFDVLENIENKKEKNYIIYNFKYNTKKDLEKKYVSHNFVYKTKKKIRAIGVLIVFIKYITTSSLIFAILLLTANYSAYVELAKAYLYSEELKVESSSILNSVEASQITSSLKEKKENDRKATENIEKSKRSKYSIKTLALETNKTKPKLDIEITPYENRVIIPKIAKNIPLLDVKQKTVSGEEELENILMKELEDGIVRYPGSAKPGDDGNTFVFGHSSNYPWIKGDYNNVFANLDNLEYEDEVIVYYGQEKYTYKIREKKVITPGDTKILKRNKNKDELTLMTCWPIGTTLNRLIVIGERIEK